MSRKLVFVSGVVVVLLLLAACGTTTVEVTREVPVTQIVEVPVEPAVEVPYQDLWASSAHNAVDTEPFRHWDDAAANPDGVPTSCARCHTTAGYQDYLGADGSEPGKVDAAVPAANAQGIQCVACHNPVTTFALTSVTFPSGVEITNLGDAARCMVCHQGRESKVSVDKFIAQFGEALDPDAVPAAIKNDQGKEVKLGFRNIHYFAAAATLYGGMVEGGYQYDGNTYDSKNTHVQGYDSCVGCHDPHTLKVKVDECAACHEGVASVEDLKNVRMVSSNPDYDGDGNVTEGMYYEIQGLQEILMAEILKYAKETGGAGIVYDTAAYPYYFADEDGDGKPDQAEGKNVSYKNWTPRLLKAAYNYQVSIKDPGAFAHGNKYIVQLLYDSIADLGGDVSALARTDAGHFAGDTEPFRHWDDTGIVPYSCAKCHSATGLPEFIASGGTMIVTGTGTTLATGIGPQPTANGFMCITCHDPNAEFPARYTIASVTFPSGKTLSLGGKDADGKFVADDSNLCVLCHQGRESTTSVNNALRGKDDDTPDSKIGFKNIHYLATGATLFGGDAAGAYQYAGKEYVGQNMHAAPTGAVNKCQDCHDVHALQPKVETCAACHGTDDPKAIRMTAPDYDGDGDVTEGVAGEVETLEEALYVLIQAYAETTAGKPIVYSAAAYPYFFVDADKDG
ncbi:MAG: cytochrome c3 family protein, partial [Chloroflexota bacterium]